ncbi:hypothetical protein NA57DRAFT_81246 [Rhizodiscina lignyota]|uniref:Uncharacterized protein n=1 Tax=Rhizodiscina lignyota TaxID=1504668 RepID=A0A9P4I4H5_9PEZI|nr:hypothetical protein NA57DRAFT_81246 [Rhizodiscina lignyota]
MFGAIEFANRTMGSREPQPGPPAQPPPTVRPHPPLPSIDALPPCPAINAHPAHPAIDAPPSHPLLQAPGVPMPNNVDAEGISDAVPILGPGNVFKTYGTVTIYVPQNAPLEPRNPNDPEFTGIIGEVEEDTRMADAFTDWTDLDSALPQVAAERQPRNPMHRDQLDQVRSNSEIALTTSSRAASISPSPHPSARTSGEEKP